MRITAVGLKTERFDRSAVRTIVQPKDWTKPVWMGDYTAPPLVDLERFEAIMINGQRGSGKSAKGEFLLEQFWKNGRIAISLTEAPFSYESMYAAIPRRKRKRIPCLFVIPRDISIEYPECKYDIATVPEDMPLDKVLRLARSEDRMIIFCHSLWGPERELEAYARLAKWINELCLVQRSLRTDMAVLIREIEMQVYSRLKSERSSKALKTALIDLVRLARSSYRITVIADLQLAQDMDRAMRGQLDKWVICSQDPQDLPEAMRWLPRDIQEKRWLFMGARNIRDRLFPSLSYLYPSEAYYVVRRKRRYVKLEFPLPSHHHKDERDDLADYGIFIKRGPPGARRPAELAKPEYIVKPKDEVLERFRARWHPPTGGLTKQEKLDMGKRILELRDMGYSYHKLALASGINSGLLYYYANRAKKHLESE